jgi:hypothetical protein
MRHYRPSAETAALPALGIIEWHLICWSDDSISSDDDDDARVYSVLFSLFTAVRYTLSSPSCLPSFERSQHRSRRAAPPTQAQPRAQTAPSSSRDQLDPSVPSAQEPHHHHHRQLPPRPGLGRCSSHCSLCRCRLPPHRPQGIGIHLSPPHTRQARGYSMAPARSVQVRLGRRPGIYHSTALHSRRNCLVAAGHTRPHTHKSTKLEPNEAQQTRQKKETEQCSRCNK